MFSSNLCQSRNLSHPACYSFSEDWRSDLLPLITGNKRRFSIFSSAEQKIINAAREMKELPDLSALIKKKLSEAKRGSSATPSETTPSGTTPREETPREKTPREKTPRGAIPPAPLPLAVSPRPSSGPVIVGSSREDLTLISERETAEPSVTGGNKKRSAPDSSTPATSQARTESDGPPKKKKKNEKKKKKSAEEQSEPAEDTGNRETVIEKSLSRDAAARGVVDSDNSPSIPLKRKKSSRSHELSTPASSASAAKIPPAAPQTLVEGGSTSEDRRVKFRDHVEFKYVGETPLSFAPTDCAELVRQIKGGRKDLPAVKDLIFKDAYVDAARTKILSDGSMNYVVELYDSALKEATSKLKQADKLARAKDVSHDRKTKEFKATIDKVAEERAQLIERKKAQKAHFLEKFGELKDKFDAAGVKIRGLEEEKRAWLREKAAMEEKMVSTALRHLKEVNRLRDSRGHEVTHERFRVQTAMIAKSNKRFSQIRDLEKRRSEFETVRSLQSQAFGTKKCLEALKESGIDIPQETIDLFAEQEKEYETAADRLAVGGIPEELLCLSPLHLRSPFLNENVWATIDPYGSNAGLIDAGTAAFLQTPSSSQGDHANEESVEPSGRELGEPSFHEGRIVGEVARLEDTTVAPALDPTTLSTSIVVNEDPLVPALGTGAETRTEAVNLLELSDSSTEEEGGEHPEETESGLVGNPQNEEGMADRIDNLPVLPADVTAQVVEGGSNRAED
ncbi:uncharacterized protein LOC125593185 [Brassica napus]|uniref:uncharacterized protein LOC106376057 n=1 Tax=Brassica napus TaxID=3708 RepID=UPI002078A7B4|nr:uncharacterized protein LOC106376057 [Brassica napus]XP_048625390.1 uncharacterized protein LOC125593185 [Brassica napus]